MFEILLTAGSLTAVAAVLWVQNRQERKHLEWYRDRYHAAMAALLDARREVDND